MLEEKGIPITPITKPIPIDLETDEEFEAALKAQKGRDPLE